MSFANYNDEKIRRPVFQARRIVKKGASTYSPALSRSTIGAGGLNCSVRNGKRWDTAAIDTRNVIVDIPDRRKTEEKNHTTREGSGN